MYIPLQDSEVGRVFEAIQYDDSCPLDKLVYYLKSLAIPAFISPLHDKDVFTEDDEDRFISAGDLKKPHRHVLFDFAGRKSGWQIKQICDGIGLVRPVLMHERILRLRYLCHFDDPDKAFYDPGEVISTTAKDYETECQKAKDPDIELRKIMAFARENRMWSYAELCDYCSVNMPEWFDTIVKYRTLVIKEYQKSLAHEPKLESINLEYKLMELRDSIEKLEKRKSDILSDRAKKAQKK